MTQNRLAVVLALIILAVILVGWIVQLGGSYKAGSDPQRVPSDAEVTAHVYST